MSSSPKRILVLGGGFAGLWSAVGAARKLDELGIGPDEVAITLVNRDAWHNIRVRNYESDLSQVRVPLAEVLDPIGVELVEASVVDFDLGRQSVLLHDSTGQKLTLGYDRMVFALGSQLWRPNSPGLVEHAYDVDTYGAAERLATHLQDLAKQPPTPGQFTVLVVGAGLTGIEVATEMVSRLKEILSQTKIAVEPCVILADHSTHVGSDLGEHARPVIERALADLGVETRTAVSVTKLSAAGVTLDSGEIIPAATVVWCAGMRASPLTAKFPIERDRFGRISVDEFLRVRNVPNVFAAGDSAVGMMDAGHASVMSCQHGRPMGRFAGHNVVADLFGQPLLPLHIDWYVTVLDLGAWGALYTEGWDRQVVAVGEQAKLTKQTINCQRIYPPLTGNSAEILAAAAPVVQQRPK